MRVVVHVLRDRVFPRDPLERVEVQEVIVPGGLAARYVLQVFPAGPVACVLGEAAQRFHRLVERPAGRAVGQQRAQGQVQRLYEHGFDHAHAGDERDHRVQRDGHVAAGRLAVHGLDSAAVVRRDQRQYGVQNEAQLGDLYIRDGRERK